MTDAAGRPLFPPEHEDAEAAREGLLKLIRTDPASRGVQRSRWTLETLRQQCPWLELETNSGMWQLLDRLGISFHRGRSFVESPDEHFDEKCEHIEQIRTRAAEQCAEVVMCLDECQYYRRPDVERGWEEEGTQPTVDRQAAAKYAWSRHVLGAVDENSGQLFWIHQASFDRSTFIDFYRRLVETYSDAQRLWLIQDNLPVHFHVDVLEQLESQTYRWAFPSSPNWPDPADAAQRDGPLPVQLVPFPTYASWLNPIERLWRDLKRNVLYLHRNACDTEELVEAVEGYLGEQSSQPEIVKQIVSLSGN